MKADDLPPLQQVDQSQPPLLAMSFGVVHTDISRDR